MEHKRPDRDGPFASAWRKTRISMAHRIKQLAALVCFVFIQDVALMRVVVGDELEVKASGGVRTFDDALAIMAAGATRIGASAGVAIVGEAAKAGGGKKQKLPEKDEGAAAKRAKDDSY